ncbi:MAG TPA: DUF4468 domain-containing protein [Mucilaginibacter sp.]
MKKILLAAAFLIPLFASAQTKQDPFNYKAEDRYLYYGDVVKVDTSFTVSDLYKDAKLFITKLALVNTKITTDDATGGTVIADIEEPATYKTQTGIGDEPMTLKYAIKIEMKKGRYRYTIDNITVSYEDGNKTDPHTLFDLNKEKGGGVIGVGKEKRVLKAMDALFLKKIDLLTATMSKRSDDF